jgi:hypothetical protein
MKLSKDYIGCKVKTIKDHDSLSEGAIGIIRGISYMSYRVEVLSGNTCYGKDAFIGAILHTCDNTILNGHGYNIYSDRLTLLEQSYDTLILLL